MKTLKIILYTLGALIIVVVITGLVVISGIKKGALPVYEGEIQLAGLASDVTVYRDERGMPHIYADNEHDLYIATGFVMAQERLWQMDLIRRATTGRLSEIFGADYIDTDLFLRSLDMTSKSKTVLSGSSEEIVNCLKAFTEGVNRYISIAGRKLPPEFRILRYKPDPWTLEDLTNIIGYMGWDLASGNLSAELFYYKLIGQVGLDKAVQLIPDWKADSSAVYPDFHLDENTLAVVKKLLDGIDRLQSMGISTFSGSNNWAVTGDRTETSKPVMSNDMHLSFGAPGIWIQMHHIVPGKLNVTGVVVPGEPFVVCGHNENIAWGMTNLSVDDIDLFAEKINPADTNQYFFNGEWRDMIIRDEVIKVKGEDDRVMKLRFTHRGPIISGFRNIEDEVLSMRWSGYDPSNELRTVYLLNRASNWDEFRSAISSFRSISQNIVYADVKGNIGLNVGGGIPLRKGSGSFIRNGETDEFDWKEYVPFEQMPSSFNPENGFVSSANNKTTDDDYPYYISDDFSLPYRINRIRQMLSEKKMYTLDDFKRMINDQHSDYAALLTPFIIKAVEQDDSLSAVDKFALEELKAWDFDMNKDEIAPSVFEFFRNSFGSNLLADELGTLYSEVNGITRDYYIYRILREGPDEWVNNVTTTENETLDDIIRRSFHDCISGLEEQYGPETAKWQWGDIHKITIEHPMGSVKLLDRVFGFNSNEYRVGGSNHTVSPYSYTGRFIVNHGASERHIFNTANWDESFTVIPTGASGIPASEFYLSQTDAYIEGSFYKDAFTEAAVKSAAKYTLILKAGE